MGTTLTGLTPATTYDALIKVGDNGPITGALKVLSDGLGTNLPMEASTTGINFTGVLTQAGTTLQPTLVSGTNIKTINGTSVLGSGNIAVVTSPSGVAGAIQFSNGSAFASDASNLFWDDTNNRLGVGTNAPDTTAHFKGGVAGSVGVRVATFEGNLPEILFKDTSNNTGFAIAKYGQIVYFVNTNASGGYSSYSGLTNNNSQWSFGGGFNPSGTVHIKGSGSTSATTSLLVQNSAGNNALQVTDDQMVRGYNGTSIRFRIGTTTAGQGVSTREGEFAVGFIDTNQSSCLRFFVASSTAFSYIDGYTEGAAKAQNYPIVFGSRANNTGQVITGSATQENGSPAVFGSAVVDASALVQINSTTRGFLPPRMTTTQKNAIASPAAGLVVYDSTTNKLCCYNGSTWNDLF